jgi:hypothetical protein
MNEPRALVIMGDFTDEEFTQLTAFLRQIDNQRPDGHFEIIGIDPKNNSLEIAERLIRKALPKLEGRESIFAKFTFGDPGGC